MFTIGKEIERMENWTLEANDRMIQIFIDLGLEVGVSSPLIFENLFDTKTGQQTVFARELRQFIKAGYRLGYKNSMLYPPGSNLPTPLQEPGVCASSSIEGYRIEIRLPCPATSEECNT